MKETLNDITSYIDFLRKNGYSVTLSCFKGRFGDCLPILLEYEIHRCPVCTYVKTNPHFFKSCVFNKWLLEKKPPVEPYYAHCYVGVEEYIYPVRQDDRTLLCIHLSGYRGKLPSSERCAARLFRYGGERFRELYEALPTDVPNEHECLALLRPLEYMVRILYKKANEQKKNISVQKAAYQKALVYIYENYTQKLSSADIADAVGYSEPHLRQLFSAEAGVPLMQFVNGVRLSRAAEMLYGTELSVTDIAFASGFSDSNYFSTAFRKKYGVSPSAYRKNNSHKE